MKKILTKKNLAGLAAIVALVAGALNMETVKQVSECVAAIQPAAEVVAE